MQRLFSRRMLPACRAAPHRDPINKLRKTLEQQDQEENFDNYKQNFFSFLQDDAGVSRDERFQYSDQVIFRNKLNKALMKTTAYGQLVFTPLALYTCQWCFIHWHPILAAVPLTVLGGQYLLFKRAQRYLHSIVYQMEFDATQNRVVLSKVSGHTPLITTIDCIRLQDVIVNQASYREGAHKESKHFASFIVAFDVLHPTDPQQNIKGLKLLVEPEMSIIENIDLFRSILNADQDEVDQFYFVEKQIDYVDQQDY